MTDDTDATDDLDRTDHDAGETDPAEEPMSDVAEDVQRRLEEADVDVDVDAVDQQLFEQHQRGEIDRETLWRQVTDDADVAETATEQIAGDASTDADDEGPTIRRDHDDATGPPSEAGQQGPVESDDRERVVEKATYCQKCEHFSEPPGVSCTNEGTEILEAVDMVHFRVRNCPIVEADEELEQL